jgi:hypothetical protein
LAARDHSIKSDSTMAELGLGECFRHMMFRLLPPSIRHLVKS